MVKKTKDDEVTKPEEEKVNQPEGAPVVTDASVPVSRETLSHQWQENSPAINTNAIPIHLATDSILDKIDTKENLQARQDAADAQLAAWESLNDYSGDCSKLDVSDARYCQPGSERHKAYLKKTK